MSRSRSRSRSRGRTENVVNPGNILYVTGLSSRVSETDLEDHFSKEGKVKSVFLVVEPRSRVSRGFAFITMDSVKDANRCIKHLNQSILEGRYITVESLGGNVPGHQRLVTIWGLKAVGMMVIVVGIVEDQIMMTMGTGGLQGNHLIAVDVITLPGDHHIMEGQEGIDRGLILRTMLVAAGETCYRVSTSSRWRKPFLDLFQSSSG